MKIKLLFFTLAFLSLFSCTNVRERRRLSEVKKLSTQYPDSALKVLEENFNPGLLTITNLADWCLLEAEVRDSLREDMQIDTLLFEKVITFYEKKKNVDTKAKAYYYYGRSLMDYGNNTDALLAFMKALEYADLAQQYNLAGYISSYMGDIYIDQYESIQAREHLLKAADYFKRANNLRSEIFANRDIAHTYLIDKEYNKALEYVSIADSMSKNLDDNLIRGSLANYYASIYLDLGMFDLSDKYILESINLGPTQKKNYYILMGSYIQQKRYKEAKHYLDSLKNLSNNTPVDEYIILKRYYLLEKEQGNDKQALHYYERSTQLENIILKEKNAEELYKVEKRYDRERLINRHNQAKIKEQQLWIIITVFGLILLLLLVTNWYINNKRKTKELMYKQELATKELEAANQELRMAAKEKEFELMKKFLMEKTLVYSKLKMVTELPLIGDKEKEYYKNVKKTFTTPFLSDTDWAMIRELIERIYPNFVKNLKEAGITHESEIDFCCLLRFDFKSDKLLQLLNMTKDGLKSKRHRIVKKLGAANQHIKLEEFLEKL